MSLDRIKLGTPVRVTHHPDKDRGYVEEARSERRSGGGLTGVAIAEHDSHGLCYEVKFPSGIVITYDREELHVHVEYVELESLVGLHVLDGRGEFVGAREGEWHDQSPRVFVLRLDGVLYWFQENPSDGYRSSLSHVRICEATDLPPGSFATFPPMLVSVRLQTQPEPDSYRKRDHRLYGVSEATGRIVFEVGTTNTDDYYPNFVARWEPNGYEADWHRPIEHEAESP